MLRKHELWRIRSMEQTASRRKQAAWMAYVNAGRRHNEAYYNLVTAQEELQSAKERLGHEHEAKIELAIADKRYRAAMEEMEYQEAERERIMTEFGIACKEHKHWSEMLKNEIITSAGKVKACG